MHIHAPIDRVSDVKIDPMAFQFLSLLGKAESKRAEQQKVMILNVMTSNNRTELKELKELKEQKGFATVLEERKPPQASGKVRREGANGRSLGARQEESKRTAAGISAGRAAGEGEPGS